MHEQKDFCESEYTSYKEWEIEHLAYCDLLRKNIRTARVVHVCNDCSEIILPGEKYKNSYFLYEGEAYEEKECEYCTETRKILADHNIYPDIGNVTRAWLWMWKRSWK